MYPMHNPLPQPPALAPGVVGMLGPLSSPTQAPVPAPCNRRKPILYYSRFCAHSRMLIAKVVQNGVRDKFACLCVDTKRHLVPSFVRAVPVLFLVDESELLREAALDEYVNAVIREKQTTATGSADGGVAPAEGNSGLAECFSWVDDAEKQAHEQNCFGVNFVPVGFTQHVKEIEEKPQRKKDEKDIEAAFQLMQAQRDAEMKDAQARAKPGAA